MKFRILLIALAYTLAWNPVSAVGQNQIRALIIDGQNNHNWRATTPLMKHILEGTGLFAVDVASALEPSEFRPDFSGYDVLVMNYNGPHWPEETRDNFESFVSEGGGLVIVHAANNAFTDWKEFNLMIGLGGWGGRNESHGPYVYYNEEGELIRDDSPGRGGSHGRPHAFAITTRQPDHPIMKGLPDKWMHPFDEIYDRLRGPAENMTVLATAHATRQTGGSGRHEPQLMTIKYGEGRVFHTCLGHDERAFHGMGFQITFQRGTQWAATGEVTIPAPDQEYLPATGDPATRDPSDI